MAQAELLLDAKAILGEGPSWDEQNGLLYWVDIQGKALHTYDISSKKTSTASLGQRIGAVVPRKSGGVVVVLEDGFYAYDLAAEKLTFLGNPLGRKDNTRFNDGKCDAAGRFWAGTMAMDDKKNQGALYCLDTDLSIRTIFENVGCSNGIAWSPDNTKMYYIDSPTKKVIAYDFDLAKGEISNPSAAIEVTEAGAVPDGMTSDAEGMLWVALWGGGGIRRWNPHTGELLLKLDIPASLCTSCVFAGPGLNDLYITSAKVGISPEQLAEQPHAGSLFIYKTDIKGMPTHAFGG